MESLLKEFDKDGSKSLNRDEVRKMLSSFSIEVCGCQRETTDADLDFLWNLCDKMSGNNDGVIGGREILAVCETWFVYMQREPKIREYFEKFDTDKSGFIDETELQ